MERLKHDIKETPGDVDIRLRLGELVMAHMSREEGAAWLQSVLFIDPGNVAACQRLAEYFSYIGNAETAKTYQQRAEQSASSKEQPTEQD